MNLNGDRQYILKLKRELVVARVIIAVLFIASVLLFLSCNRAVDALSVCI